MDFSDEEKLMIDNHVRAVDKMHDKIVRDRKALAISVFANRNRRAIEQIEERIRVQEG